MALPKRRLRKIFYTGACRGKRVAILECPASEGRVDSIHSEDCHRRRSHGEMVVFQQFVHERRRKPSFLIWVCLIVRQAQSQIGIIETFFIGAQLNLNRLKMMGPKQFENIRLAGGSSPNLFTGGERFELERLACLIAKQNALAKG